MQLVVRWGGTTHHAYLTVNRWPGNGYPTPAYGDTRATAPTQLPSLTDKTFATKPGTPFGVVNDGFYLGQKRPRLVTGSTVASEALNVNSEDFVAVLRVKGNMGSVLKRYIAQLGGGQTSLVGPDRTLLQHGKTTDAKRVSYFVTSPEGGGSGFMLGDPTGRWILVHTRSD